MIALPEPALPEPLPEEVRAVLARPDLRLGLDPGFIAVVPHLDRPFEVAQTGHIRLGRSALGDPFRLACHLRHALELAMLLRAAPGRPTLAGLAAVRCAALFAARHFPPLPGGGAAELAILARAEPPAPEALAALWPALASLQPGAAAELPAGVAEEFASLWPFLGPAEALMETGGDARLKLDPLSGLNGYGSSFRPRPWAVTYASSTASSTSERGYAAAEATRQRLLFAAFAGRGSAALAEEAESIRRAILAWYDLPPGSAAILAPSGTDCELYALALLQPADGRTLINVLAAPEETGSGVPLAAEGRHFASDTARGVAVAKGSPIEGFVPSITMRSVPARGTGGRMRPEAVIEADFAALAAAAEEAGAEIILHLLDVSKTGFLLPGVTALRVLAARHERAVNVVVDACQARTEPDRIRFYIENGWLVLITGSKFFTGPPFCGAVLVPPNLASRLEAPPLPAGLAAYAGRGEFPAHATAASGLDAGTNLGLVLRWQAALAEMRAFAAVPRAERLALLDRFLSRVAAAIASHPDLVLLIPPGPERPPLAHAWDRQATIMGFAVLAPGQAPRRPLNVAAARRLYRWLNADFRPVLPHGASEKEQRLAGRLCHIGQPVALAGENGEEMGILRLSAGARLVSGEPSLAHLDPDSRIEREIADAMDVLAKISLILRQWSRLEALDPSPSFS